MDECRPSQPLNFVTENSSACRSKSSGAARGIVELTHPRRFGRDDLFDDQLADLTPGRKRDRFVAGVVEQTTNLTAIIGIDHTGEHIQPVLRRESRPWRNASIKPGRYGDREARPRHHSLFSFDLQILNRTNIQPRRERTPAPRQHRTRIELFEAENVHAEMFFTKFTL